MRLSDFDYELPQELIAQEPLRERDSSRLLVMDRESGSLEHRHFRELGSFLNSGDRLVVNDTRVVPARLLGRRDGATGEIEILLLGEAPGRERHPTYLALARPARKLTPDTTVHLGREKVPVRIAGAVDEKKRLVEFPLDFDVSGFLERDGHLPLPPYIRRPDTRDDRERYQTVFARHAGAVAAPTAGLHFTPRLLESLPGMGVGLTTITLDVGPGTFMPVTAEDPRDHVMEPEPYWISSEAAGEINQTRERGGRVVAVGTTAVRALESHASSGGEASLEPGEGRADAFIYDPYRFRVVDALITNFHLPCSTLLMLVSAFCTHELLRRAYRAAVAERYRFYSYGDAMLIL